MNNVGLLDCMIRPLGERASSQRSDNEENRSRKSNISNSGLLSESKDDALLSLNQQQQRKKNLRPAGTSTSKSLPSSKSIPISNIKRTASEIQLHEDEALADWRDYVMYSRIVNGMSRKRAQQEVSHHHDSRTRYASYRSTTSSAADQSLANIIRTRNLPVDDFVSAPSPSSPLGLEEYHYLPNLVDVAPPVRMRQQQQQRSPYLDFYGDNADTANTNNNDDDEERDEGIFLLEDL